MLNTRRESSRMREFLSQLLAMLLVVQPLLASHDGKQLAVAEHLSRPSVYLDIAKVKHLG